MSVTINRPCGRCHRNDPIHVATAEAAPQAGRLNDQRIAKAKEVKEYLQKVPKELMPDLIAYARGSDVAVHASLCDPKEDEGKRSCLKRGQGLMEQAGELSERKPRTQKPKSPPLAASPEPAQKAGKHAKA